MDLTEWTINFVKHKDLIKKNLVSVNVKDKLVEFIFKDKKTDYHVMESLDEAKINKIIDDHKDDAISVVCIHNKSNFDFLTTHFEKIAKKNITLIFVSFEHHDKWIINPMLHSKIADKKTLKQGLKTMFDASMGKVVTELL